MRGPKLLVIVALAAVAANPITADARPRIGIGTIVGVATAPLRAIRNVAGMAAGRRAMRSYASTRRSAAAQGTRVAGIVPARPLDRSEPAGVAQAVWSSASPAAYEDLLGYALWPKDYGDRFWSHGYGDIVKVMAPAPAASTVVISDSGGEAVTTGSVATAVPCGPDAKDYADKPIARVEATIELDDAQRSALGAVRTALIDAIEKGKAVCRSGAQATPAERLGTLVEGFWAMRDAAVLVRVPLQTFYDTLADAQKAQLTGTPEVEKPARRAKAKTKHHLIHVAAGARSCAVAPSSAIAWVTGRIEQAIKPNEEQRARLQALGRKSGEMAGFLMMSCPQETVSNPVDRLDAAGDRMSALLYAAMAVQPAFNEFYGSLTDQQKAQLSSLAR
jgi:hypothetical protein